MAEALFHLTIFILKTLIVVFSLVVFLIVLPLSIPFVLIWPRPSGMLWRDVIRSRIWRVTKFAYRTAEYAFIAVDMPG